MKFFLLLIAFTAALLHGNAQNLSPRDRDSMLHLLSVAKEDTNKVLLYNSTGLLYERSQPDSAAWFYLQGRALSKKLGWKLGEIKFISNYTAVLNLHDKFDESLQLNLQAIDLAKSINNKYQLACAYSNTGASYYGLKRFSECIDYFLKSIPLLEELDKKPQLVTGYGNLCGLFNQVDDYGKSYSYGLKAIKLARELDDKYSLEEALINTSSAVAYLGKTDSALILLKETKLLALELDDKYEQLSVDINVADLYQTMLQYDNIKPLADEALKLSTEIDSKEGMAKSILFLANYSFYKKDYASAKGYAEKALAITKENGLPQVMEKTYLALSKIALVSGDVSKYQYYSDLQDSLKNLTINDRVRKNTAEFEAKYSLDKKQSEIDKLNKEKQIRDLTLAKRKTINIALIGAVVVLLLLAFLYNKNYRQKKKLLTADAVLKEQRITELENEKQLSATRSVLQGQEEERSRLAKDLHDGLGGILSSAKYSFSNMKSNMIITPENADAFDRSMAMLDRSISELRRVSHNMMPEALMKFGLNTALADYCNSINQSGAIELSYRSFGMTDETIPASKASVIYRIVQELINNMMKHAEAKTALVQFIVNEIALSITVEDDGKGFDASTLDKNDGIGYANLQNRVTYLKGTMDLHTSPGKGVSVNIEIPDINA